MVEEFFLKPSKFELSKKALLLLIDGTVGTVVIGTLCVAKHFTKCVPHWKTSGTKSNSSQVAQCERPISEQKLTEAKSHRKTGKTPVTLETRDTIVDLPHLVEGHVLVARPRASRRGHGG